jgi:hypothetical protein
VLFKKSPFLALFGLPSFAVIAPLNGIAHRRHFVLSRYSGLNAELDKKFLGLSLER